MSTLEQEPSRRTAQGTAPAGYSFTVRPDALANMFAVFANAVSEYDVLLETVAREIASVTGDACNLRVLSADGQSLEAIVPRDMEPALRDAMLATVRASADISDWGPWRSVIEDRRLLRFALVPPPDGLTPRQAEFVRQYDVRHMMIAPLIARGRVIGGISLTRRGRDVAYTAADEAFILDLAARAAVVIDDSRLLLAERTARTAAERDLADRVRAETDLEQARRRLEALYELSKLFASFENVEQTFAPALDIATGTLPLRSAILIETDGSRSKMTVWPSEGQSADSRVVQAHVEAAYGYLVGVVPTGSLKWAPGEQAPGGDLARRLIVIPLVVAHQPPFGVLQLEGIQPFDKTDLMFVNAIANQLAIALDRDRAWRRDIARREDAEKGRTRAEARGATSERERLIAESSSDRYEALAADNARLYAEAQQALRAREQILAIVSHDLKNPLGAILMTTAALAKTGVVEERRRGLPRAVDRIHRSAQRMLRLIEDLLDFASIEAGHLAIRRKPQDPGAMIHEILATFESVAQEKGLRLIAEVEPNLPQVYCDRDRILQVLSNLVGNATKVLTEGQITLRVEGGEQELLFVVSDDGPGIGPEDLGHLFERYWRSGEAQYKGTGLGLAIARGIVVAHGGRIWAESELGAGATFSFTIPAADLTLLFKVPGMDPTDSAPGLQTIPSTFPPTIPPESEK